MQGINTTNVVAVFLLLIGMFAAVRAAMPTHKHAMKDADTAPNSAKANAASLR